MPSTSTSSMANCARRSANRMPMKQPPWRTWMIASRRARADGKAGRRRRRRRDLHQLEGEAEAWRNNARRSTKPSAWAGDLMAQAGCVVHVANNGAVAVKYGLIRPDDRNDMVQPPAKPPKTAPTKPLVSLPSPKTRPVHSEKLVRCLTAHRVAAVQAELLDRPTWRWPRSPHIWRKRFSGATISTIAARRTSSPSARPTANPTFAPPPRTWGPVPPGRSFSPSAPPQ